MNKILPLAFTAAALAACGYAPSQTAPMATGNYTPAGNYAVYCPPGQAQSGQCQEPHMRGIDSAAYVNGQYRGTGNNYNMNTYSTAPAAGGMRY